MICSLFRAAMSRHMSGDPDEIRVTSRKPRPMKGAISAAGRRVLRKLSNTRTIALAVVERPEDSLLPLQRAGAVIVTAGPETPWGLVWRTAVELSWSTASAG